MAPIVQTPKSFVSAVKGKYVKAPKAKLPSVSSQPVLPYADAPYNLQTLQKMGAAPAADPTVWNMQTQLKAAGYPVVVDGVSGPQTATAMAHFLRSGKHFTALPHGTSAQQLSAPPPQMSQDQINTIEGNQALSVADPYFQSATKAASSSTLAGVNAVAQPLATVGKFIAPPLPTSTENRVLDAAFLLPIITGPARIAKAAVIGGRAFSAADKAAPAAPRVAKALGEGGKSLAGGVGHVNALGAVAGSQVTAAALGAPGGLVASAEHPIRFSKELYKQFTSGLTNTSDPTMMALDWFALLSGGRGAAARLGAAADAIHKGENPITRPGHEGGSILARPTTKLRSIKIPNGTEHPLLESNNHFMRDIQGVHDALINRAIGHKPFGKVAKYGYRRIAGYQMAARRISEGVDMSLASRLKALTKPGIGGLDEAEHKALQLTDNNTSVDDRINYVKSQLLKSTTPEEADLHAKELKVLGEVQSRGLTQVVHDEEGKPHVTIDPDKAGHLAAVDGVLAAGQELNKHINAETGAIGPEQEQQRIDNPGRIMRGGVFGTYAEQTLNDLAESPKRQSIVDAMIQSIGHEQTQTEMNLLDAQAIRFAKEHGNPRMPSRFYDKLLSISHGEPLHPEALLQLADHLNGKTGETFNQESVLHHPELGAESGTRVGGENYTGGFTSHLRNTIASMPEKFSPQELMGRLKSTGVKDEESEWAGLPKFLETAGKSVSKEEVMLWLDQNALQVVENLRGENSGGPRQFHENTTKFENYTLPGGSEANYHELTIQLPTHKYGDLFSYTSHFPEQNILAHTRFTDRIVDGKKSLLLEEIQSDWHQHGQSEGYKEPQTEEQKAALNSAIIKRDALRARRDDAHINADRAEDREEREAARATASRLHREWIDAQNHVADLMPRDNGVANAPFKKTWHELAFKRMLKWAVDHDYENMSWTTGESQAERYGLGEWFKSLHVTENNGEFGGSSYDIVGTKHDGSTVHHFAGNGKELTDTVGYDMAEQIMNGKTHFEGDDLVVGSNSKSARGASLFYDKKLVSFANKYLRPHGVEVKSSKIDSPEQSWEMPTPGSGRGPEHGTRVHSVDINDAVRHFVTEGQRLFQRGGPYNPESTIKDQSGLDTPGAYGVKGAITIHPHGAHLHTFESSDFSTWSHELLGHFNLAHGALDKNAMRSVIRAADIKGVKGVNPKLTLEDLTPEERTHVHEFFARQLESWLKQGRTSNPQLTQTMRRAATTMGDIYAAGELPELAPRVASLFDRLFSGELPKGEGIIGGDSEWVGRGYQPGALTEPNANPAASRRFSGPQISRAQSSLPKKRYTGKGMENSQHPSRPAYQFAKHLQRNVRDLQTLKARKEAADMGTTEVPTGVEPKDMFLVNDQELKGATVPDWAKQAIGKTRSTQDEVSDSEAESMFKQFHARLFVTADAFRDAFRGDPEKIKAFEDAFQDGTAVKGYKWVHPSLIGKDLKQVAQNSNNKLWKVNDAVTHAEKNLVVYLKPGHFATRFMANAGFNVVQGAFSPRTLLSSLHWYYGLKPSEFEDAVSLSKDERHKAMAVGGQGYAQSLEGSDHGLGAQFGHAGARFYASWVDAPARFNAVVHEAKRAGYNTLPKFRELLNSTDPKTVADRNRIGIKANREAGDYARMGPTEQRIIRRIFYFYPWVKASTLWAGRALVEHPIQSAALLNAGIIGNNIADQRLGKRDERDQSLIPFGHGAGLTTSNPSGLSPIATPAELIQSVEALAGTRPTTTDNQPSSWLSPVVKTAGDLAYHLGSFGDAANPNQSAKDIIYNDLIGSSPEAGLYKALTKGPAKATANPKEFPTSQESGLERFGAGSWFPRKTTQDTMNYEGYKEEADLSGNTGDLDTYNLTHAAAKVGITNIPSQVIKEIHSRADLMSQMKSGMDSGHRAIITAQFIGNPYYLKLAHEFQHNEVASSRLYAALRKVVYGNYLNYKAEITALQHRQDALGG